ncbi:MptD family putative ECF transporter S component [Clostridium sp. D2Q-14]|uniref:MptD family putative ECF transporter S component n=1 Tax=Anaeromonas gelatinilytica TaxID=2683194 RepID=UPI00193C2E6A|nr:MptD family putative ECF transporter S component [Anaeromonas gelatinilytica]MBS4534342.1 MptD family putative ECF transporter S component [Anaeromonas gelatinilytica]
MNSSKSQAKDLVNIGIYSSIYLVITMLLSFLSLIPVFHPLLAILCPIVGGVPFMLFLTKTRKFGMITIMGIIMGIVMLLTGMGYFCLFTGLVFGLLADIVAKSGNYVSAKKSILTSGVFSIWYVGNYLAAFIIRQSHYDHIIKSFGQEYADAYMSFYPNWMLPVLFAVCFISGIIGGFLGKALLKKHFKKAGIA